MTRKREAPGCREADEDEPRSHIVGLILTANECMFERSKSACLPRGGEPAPTRCLARERQDAGDPRRASRGLAAGRQARQIRVARTHVHGDVRAGAAAATGCGACRGANRPGDDGPGTTDPGTTDPAARGSAVEGPATEPPTTTDPADLKADRRECWRVEATPERTLPPTTYELCHDLAADRWLLSRS